MPFFAFNNQANIAVEIDLDSPTTSTAKGNLPSALRDIRGATYHNNTIYAITNTGDLWTINISDLSMSRRVASFGSTLRIDCLASHDGSLYFVTRRVDSGGNLTGGTSLRRINLGNTPINVTLIGEMPASRFTGLVSHGGKLYGARPSRDLYEIDLSSTSTSTLIGSITNDSTIPIGGLASNGTNVYAIGGRQPSKLIRVDLTTPADSVIVGDIDGYSGEGTTEDFEGIFFSNINPSVRIVSMSSLTIRGGGSVLISAESSDEDGKIVSTVWTADGGSFFNPNAGSTRWTAPNPDNETIYTLTHTVTDSDGATSTATIRITVFASFNLPNLEDKTYEVGSMINLQLPEAEGNALLPGSQEDSIFSGSFSSQNTTNVRILPQSAGSQLLSSGVYLALVALAGTIWRVRFKSTADDTFVSLPDALEDSWMIRVSFTNNGVKNSIEGRFSADADPGEDPYDIEESLPTNGSLQWVNAWIAANRPNIEVELFIPEGDPIDESYSIVGLPEGLSFDPGTRIVSGIAREEGSFPIQYISDIEFNFAISDFVMDVVGIPGDVVENPDLFFDPGFIPTSRRSRYNSGLRGRTDYLSLDATNGQFNAYSFNFIADGLIEVSGFSFRDRMLEIVASDLSSLGISSLFLLFNNGQRTRYLPVSRTEGNSLVVDDPHQIIKEMVESSEQIRFCIVDRRSLGFISPIQLQYYFKIDNTEVDPSELFLNFSCHKGIHSIGATEVLPDIGEARVKIKEDGVIWNEDGSILWSGNQVTQRVSRFSFGVRMGIDDYTLWSGRIEEINKSENVGRNQEVVEIVARDIINELNEVSLPSRSSGRFTYRVPGHVTPRTIREGDIVVPMGHIDSSGIVDGDDPVERFATRNSLRNAFYNIMSQYGTLKDSDLITWSESEQRDYIGIESKHDDSLLSVVEDVLLSEYAFLWSDRNDEIRTVGRNKLGLNYSSLHEGVLPVLSDGSVSRFSILGIGELNYSRIKIETKVKGEINRFPPSRIDIRNTSAKDNNNIFWRSIDFDGSDEGSSPYIVGAMDTALFEVDYLQITKDNYRGIVEEGITELFQNQTYFADYSEGRDFFGVVPLRSFVSESDRDNDIDIDIFDANVGVGSLIAADDRPMGLSSGETKSWMGGLITASVFYTTDTLFVSITNNSQRRIGISRIVALGRMIKSKDKIDHVRSYGAIDNNELVYGAKYIHPGRNGSGGIGSESTEIAEIINLQYNKARRWPISCSIEASRNLLSFLNAMESEIGSIVVVNSIEHEHRELAIVVSEDWKIQWPALKKVVTLAPLNTSLEPNNPEMVFQDDTGIPEAPAFYGVFQDGGNLVIWSPSRIQKGSQVEKYVVEYRERTAEEWSTLIDTASQSFKHTGVEGKDFVYRVKAVNGAMESDFTPQFPNENSSNLRPQISSLLADVNIARGRSITRSLDGLFFDPDKNELTITVTRVSGNSSTLTQPDGAGSVTVRGDTEGVDVYSVNATDGIEPVSFLWTITVGPPPPPPPPPPQIGPSCDLMGAQIFRNNPTSSTIRVVWRHPHNNQGEIDFGTGDLVRYELFWQADDATSYKKITGILAQYVNLTEDGNVANIGFSDSNGGRAKVRVTTTHGTCETIDIFVPAAE